MAVAEARAAWQRSANRCFVQEDAKRAQKLSCCPSPAASTTQIDLGPTTVASGQAYGVSGFVSTKRNSSHGYLPHSLREWPQAQPLYGYRGGWTNEQLMHREADTETLKGGFLGKTSCGRVDNNDGDTFGAENFKAEPSLDTQSRIHFESKDPAVEMQEQKNDQEPFKIKSAEESFEFIDMDPKCWEDSFEICSGSETSWSRIEKSEPWWRTANGDALAFLFEQGSLDLIDNCDLPKSQNTHCSEKTLHAHLQYYDNDSTYQTVDTSCNGHTGHRPISVTCSNNGMAEVQITEKDFSKAELLEALRHSQTRARQAEDAAKQANEVKEHVLDLFFKQSSHLFAYKQWFQLQQLQNFYLWTRNDKIHPVSDIFPVALPLRPQKTSKIQSNLHKTGKGSRRNKQRRSRSCNSNKYSFIIASLWPILIGAGLFFGWTAGWILLSL